MKKIGMKILSIILAMSLLIGGSSATTTASAADLGKTLENAGLSVVALIFSTLVGGLNFIVPDSKDFVKVEDRVVENFYEGTETWEDDAKADAKWILGHADASLIPDDELNEEKIIPSALDKNVALVVAAAVIKAAKETGVSRITKI